MKKQGDSSRLHKQANGELDYEQDGLIRGHLIFEGDVAHIKEIPDVGDVHPVEPKAFCFARKLTYLTLSRIRATCEYIGLDHDPSDFIIEGLGGLSREAIETHKHFESKLAGTPASPKNRAIFTETGKFDGWPIGAPHRLGGQDAFYLPTISIRRTYWTARLPEMKEMGTIFGRPADISMPPNVKDCLWGPTTYRSIGPMTKRFYQVSQEILGSGPEGWNTYIYG